MKADTYTVGSQKFTRVYAEYLEETPTEVLIRENGKRLTLQRCRMYNSQIIRGYIYTDYADKEYQQLNSSIGARKYEPRPVADKGRGTSRVEAAKRGWETRKNAGR